MNKSLIQKKKERGKELYSNNNVTIPYIAIGGRKCLYLKKRIEEEALRYTPSYTARGKK